MRGTMWLRWSGTVLAIAATMLAAGVAVAQEGSDPTSEPAELSVQVDSFDHDLVGEFAYSLKAGLPFEDLLAEPGRLTPIEPNTWDTIEGLAPGPYTLTLETLPSDTVAQSLACNRDGGSPLSWEQAHPDLPGSGLTTVVDLEPGSINDCTFWLERQARLRVEVVPRRSESNGVFEYSLKPGLPFDDLLSAEVATTAVEIDTPSSRRGLSSGPYTLTLETLPEDFVALAIVCELDGRTIAEDQFDTAVLGSGRTVTLDLRAGDDVGCEFHVERTTEVSGDEASDTSEDEASDTSEDEASDTSEDEASVAPEEPEVSQVLAPKPGRWRSVVTASSTGCGNRGVGLPKPVSTGPVQVKNGGRRIVVVAERRIVLDQVDGKPGLYRGTLKERSTGRAVLLRYEVTVVDPERMEGTLRANFRAKGEKCWIRQSWNSSYVGK